MKKQIMYFVIFFLPAFMFAQSGKVFDNLSMKTEILDGERNYAIYLPPDYETSQRSYPVLYLLHGMGDNHTGWVQFGEVLNIADKAIKEGKATPMIIVMPDADTKFVGYINRPNDNWNYEDFFFREFIPFIEKTYRIKSEKRYRAIAGLSMGGEGTFFYALHHPEMFSSACPLSAATGPLTIDDMDNFFQRRKIKDVSQVSAEEFFKKYSVINLVNNMPEDQKKSVRWYIDCGDDDFLFEGNSLVHIAMCKKEIPHEYRVRDGGHTWTYWRSALPTVLGFISDSFHQH